MTIKDAVKWGKEELEKANIENAEYDSFELLSAINGMTKTFYFINGNALISEEVKQQFEESIEKRKNHIPLQHILGKAYFYGLEFNVNENVLIPRQDTEVLVGEVIKLSKPEDNILDMCTGSGCIAISLAKNIKDSTVLGIDISLKALEVANSNKELNQADNVSFINGDLFTAIKGGEITENYVPEEQYLFDIIVSNPPYIPTGTIDELQDEVKLHDPIIALDGKEDGLAFYREITEKSKYFLKEDGYLCYEIGYDQGDSVSDIMREYEFRDVRVIKDLAGLDRVVIGKR